jgi:hypothetical protein
MGWAGAAGVDQVQLRLELNERGAYCDCEVVLNICEGG